MFQKMTIGFESNLSIQSHLNYFMDVWIYAVKTMH